MWFTRSGRSIFPLLPPYGAHDPNNQGRATTLHPDDITPYLGLRARLSQVWVNRWTILILLVLVRALLATTSINSEMASAKREALSACTAVEAMGSAMASMPHYLAAGVNELVASGIDDVVDGFESVLTLTVTGVEEIVIYILKVMYQTYLCLITLAVRGAVDVAVDLLEDAVSVINSTISAIGDDINSAAETFEDALDEVKTIVAKVGIDIPTLDLTKYTEKLTNISLPSSIDDDLEKLNSSIPSFAEVKNLTETVIETPFEEVKKLIKSSLGTYSFDSSALPVPAKKALTFCNDNDGIDEFFQEVGDVVVLARKIFIIVLVIAAVLACIPSAWQEIRRWRHMKERSRLVRKEAHDPMDVVYIVSRPYTAAAGIKAASHFSNSRRQILVRWVVAYATSIPALFVLGIGVAGLFACLCQYILLRSVERAVPELTAEVTAFADKVVAALNNASAEWTTEANTVIEQTNTNINDDLFSWVNISTLALNDTLNAFVDDTVSLLNETFGNTVLKDAILDVFECVVGLKVEGIEKALTWVNEHAKIDFPTLPNNTFSLGAAASIGNSSDSFLSTAGDTTSNEISEVVVRVVDEIKEGIRTETMISMVLVLIWVLIACIGILRALTLFWGREKNRGDGGGMPFPASVTHHNNHNHSTNVATDVENPFDDVHLATLSNDRSQPAPRYEFAKAQSGPSGAAVSDEQTYQDEKLGFAGQRSLKVDGGLSALRGSSYVEYDSGKH
ncbi:hypothetical protein ASPZODRAFT_129938 [Penicilliopsis zonata CBS 506.65]|uniref:Plasma membrane fusion protein PRM1 n=1 Tax=Penicilliopsis zonata CBS 506.65 TaxID=1073090 RepID=A0A1L9SQT3_9EURO|nr:hypothetical protein ASPZODRAFT_129938 [Penicilliopsis zonata CBS 506.65]OJJ49463.1 hypothetical protein ASPZODRAFT_129938 [Penicilliopsis zonata CBS 506.65]